MVTTAKICLIDEGYANHSRFLKWIEPIDSKKVAACLRIPVIEMVEIELEEVRCHGSIRCKEFRSVLIVPVGPRSGLLQKAGTTSDADAVMGKLYPQFFAGGDLTLNVGAAKFAIREQWVHLLG